MEHKENTLLGDVIAGATAAYDKQSKEVLAWKPILARIFKRIMRTEFENFPLEQVEHCIEGEPEIAIKPVNPAEKIDGMSNENSIPGEGIVYYDIVTHVILPNNERTKVIINLEAQKKDDPGYDLVTRAIFYCARLISQQLGTEFTNKTDNAVKYDGIKKVCSIWICMDAQKNQADSIYEYSIKQEEIFFGKHDGRQRSPKKHRYDLMRAVMIYLNSPDWEDSSDNLIGMLTTLLGKMDKEAKKKKLQDDYGLQMVKEFEEKVNEMCNLGEGLVEKSKAEGKIEEIKRLIKAEITTLDVIKQSGLYTADELKAIATP